MNSTKKRYNPSATFMTILELQDKLGNQVRKVLREDLSTEEREIANEESRMLIGFANQMINAGNLMLNAEKTLAQIHDLDESLIKDIIY